MPTPNDVERAVNELIRRDNPLKTSEILYRLLEWFGVSDDAGEGAPARHATVAAVPGGGWCAIYKNDDGTYYSYPIICWRVQIDGTVVPVTCDRDGVADDDTDTHNAVLFRHKDFGLVQLTEEEKAVLAAGR